MIVPARSMSDLKQVLRLSAGQGHGAHGM